MYDDDVMYSGDEADAKPPPRLKKRGRKQDSVSSVEKDGVYQTSNVLQVIDKNSQHVGKEIPSPKGK